MSLFDEIDFLGSKTPEELAGQVLQVFFNGRPYRYPINPYEIMTEFGIIYRFQDFDQLEGVYIAPTEKEGNPFVGINKNRRPTRQRFTAAHEICHHIKDRRVITQNNNFLVCPIGSDQIVERFANNFAAALLMPKEELSRVADLYSKGFVEFKDILFIAQYFGVSFSACTFRLAYQLKRIEGNVNKEELQKRIDQFQPEKARDVFGVENKDQDLLESAIDFYTPFIQRASKILWYRFKTEFIYNENRLEGLNTSKQKVQEILTDLHVHQRESKYCVPPEENNADQEIKEISEIAGHNSMIEYVYHTNDPITIFKLLTLNKLLYCYSPFPEGAGKFRETNNIVMEGRFETSDYHQIIPQIIELDRTVNALVQNKKNLSIPEFIFEAVKIHHRLTVIHPFLDGNGRVTRAFLIWLFKIKELPPVYIKLEMKKQYREALSIADQRGDYDPLFKFFYSLIINSLTKTGWEDFEF